MIDSPQTVVILSDSIRDAGLQGYRSTFRLQVSSLVYTLLGFAYQAPTCTLQQQEQILDAQQHCVKEFQSLADQVLVMLSSMLQYDALPGRLVDRRANVYPTQLEFGIYSGCGH